MKTSKKIIGVCVFAFCMICLLIWVGRKVYNQTAKMHKSFDEDLPATFDILKQDSLLINPDFYSRIIPVEVRNSKVRSSISRLLVDKRYSLFTYKLDTTANLNFSSIKLANVATVATVGKVYNIISGDGFYKFEYKAGAVPAIKSLYLTLEADTIITVAYTDSILNYECSCKSMSIRYEDKGSIDLYITGPQKLFFITPVSMSIMFKKMGRDIYLLILAGDAPGEMVPAHLLASMTN